MYCAVLKWIEADLRRSGQVHTTLQGRESDTIQMESDGDALTNSTSRYTRETTLEARFDLFRSVSFLLMDE